MGKSHEQRWEAHDTANYIRGFVEGAAKARSQFAAWLNQLARDVDILDSVTLAYASAAVGDGALGEVAVTVAPPAEATRHVVEVRREGDCGDDNLYMNGEMICELHGYDINRAADRLRAALAKGSM